MYAQQYLTLQVCILSFKCLLCLCYYIAVYLNKWLVGKNIVFDEDMLHITFLFHYIRLLCLLMFNIMRF